MTDAVSGALRRSLNLARPDDVYNAIVDAHRDLDDEQCRAFDARLILLLVNHVGDDAVIREALAAARESLPRDPLPHDSQQGGAK